MRYEEVDFEVIYFSQEDVIIRVHVILLQEREMKRVFLWIIN